MTYEAPINSKSQNLIIEAVDITIPSQRLGKGILFWLLLSLPIVWLVHTLLFGMLNIISDSTEISQYATAIIYIFLFIEFTSDIFNSISTMRHNRNTALGYLFGTVLSMTNIGFLYFVMDSSYGPLIMIIAISIGYLTGMRIESKMNQSYFSEDDQQYLERRLQRTFPIEYLEKVLSLVNQDRYSELQYLGPRHEEYCCGLEIIFGRKAEQAFVKVFVEQNVEFKFRNALYILPWTNKKIVLSKPIQKKSLLKARNSQVSSNLNEAV